MTLVYTLADFERIKKEGFTYALPAETLRNIKTISTNVGAPEYIKTPHFEKRQQASASSAHHSKHRAATREISDEEWDSLRNFKVTTIEKKKGIELSIDKIRKHLNKMTDKTYETLKTQIIAEIDTILGVNEYNDILVELNRIGDAIFEIASGNSFYSKMYASLYNDLMSKYEFMKTILAHRLATDTDSSFMKNFEYSNPNTDYDQFCKNNKMNEKRRALGLFYVNMMLLNIIPVATIASMTEELQTDILKFIRQENNVNIVEEMSELIFILITHSISRLKGTNEWAQIVARVNLISEMKPKSEPSIYNKTIFKHMDIQPLLKKQ